MIVKGTEGDIKSLPIPPSNVATLDYGACVLHCIVLRFTVLALRVFVYIHIYPFICP